MLSCSCTAATKLNTTAVRFFFLFFQSELFIWFFVHDPKGFIGGCVCNSSFRLLGQTKRKIFLHFCSTTAASKWNAAAIRFQLLFESGLFIWLLGWEKSCHVFIKSESWTCSLSRFQELHQSRTQSLQTFWPAGQRLEDGRLWASQISTAEILWFRLLCALLRAVGDSEGAMFHVKCFRKVATATLHEIYPSFSEEQEYILAILFYVCYPFGNCSFIML